MLVREVDTWLRRVDFECSRTPGLSLGLLAVCVCRWLRSVEEDTPPCECEGSGIRGFRLFTEVG